MNRSLRPCTFLVVALWWGGPATSWAQETGVPAALTQEAFLTPPPEIAEAVLAPRYRNVTLSNPSPDGRFFAIELSDGSPSMASFARPHYRLGGLLIDWRANRRQQLSARSATGLEVIDGTAGATMPVQVPAGAHVSAATWSPDGSRLAFLAHLDDGSYVYVADPATGHSRRVTRSPILATLDDAIAWTPDSRSVLVVLLPEHRGPALTEAAVPEGPQVRLTTPETNRLRTYPDLLESPYEKALLEYYSTGQLAVVDVASGRERRLGSDAMIREVEVAPDGKYVLVTTMRKPFSYIVPVSQFASATEIWNLTDGGVVAVVDTQDVRDGDPDDAGPGPGEGNGRRHIAWRPDGKGLSFIEAEPRTPGDSAAREQSPSQDESARPRRRDHVMLWEPPFDGNSLHVVYDNATRLSDARYSPDAATLFLTEQQGETTIEYAVRLSEPTVRHTLWRGRRRGGFGGGDGPNLVTKALLNGTTALRVSPDGRHVLLAGIQRFKDPMQEGPKSYIDRVEVQTATKERVYESQNDGVYERVLDVLDDAATRLAVSRETKTDVPNSFIRNVASGDLRQVTHNVDPTPDLTRAVRKRYAVQRPDGFEFAVDVTLPEHWSGERLPGLIWFYPREYTDQGDYDETRERWNKNGFPNLGPRSMDFLVRRGYAVIAPDMPIVGERGRMNDNYVNDLRNDLAAAIDFLDHEGIIDRARLGVGGHSYGAFSTVNAMVHTPFFKAGIAGDGNYNRTLTPFAFQTERRTLWQARDLYFSMSPLFYATHLTGALLMYHNADDQNVGTFPINSWRLFESLEALGKTAALYVYPYEEHGPATKETLLDLWARWTSWLDLYVKNAGVTAKAAAGASGRDW